MRWQHLIAFVHFEALIVFSPFFFLFFFSSLSFTILYRLRRRDGTQRDKMRETKNAGRPARSTQRTNGILGIIQGKMFLFYLRTRRRARPSASAWRSVTRRSIPVARSAPATTRPSAAIARSIKRVVSATPATPGAEDPSISTSTSSITASVGRCP